VRQIVDRFLREGARHDGVGPAIQIACDVFQRLPVADRAGAQYRIPTELFDGQLKSKTSS